MKPLVLVNFKLYPQATAERALALAEAISEVKTFKYTLAVAPSLPMLREIALKPDLLVFSQHCDPVSLGAHTGKISPEELKSINVFGTILNHSEKKISPKVLKETVLLCQKNHLITVVCASTLKEVENIAKLRPDYLAYEPKSLIGGNISVTEAKPEIISEAVKLVKKISSKTKLLCGAGIHSRRDLQQALDLGAEGVLIAHAVCKANDPKEFLEEMVK